jgi:hypothetical protein
VTRTAEECPVVQEMQTRSQDGIVGRFEPDGTVVISFDTTADARLGAAGRKERHQAAVFSIAAFNCVFSRCTP